ncbi:MAG: hypothetical protein ACRC6I_04620 [Paracoccaceae bacterium]
MALFCAYTPVYAGAPDCQTAACGPVAFTLSSVSSTARYGVLVQTAATPDCTTVQFVIADGAAGVVGQTMALQPGAVQVVRIGAGYAEGEHALRVTASGCQAQPAVLRRVTLGKRSPDHGWRAAAVLYAVTP